MEHFSSIIESLYNDTVGLPSYNLLLTRVKWGVIYCHSQCNATASYSPLDFIQELKTFARVDWKYDISVCFLFALIWMMLRYVVVKQAAKVCVFLFI